MVLRLAFTVVAVALMVFLLANGYPLGGLLFVPLLAIWIRHRAESWN